MIPLQVLWKWLWVHFVPMQSNDGGVPINTLVEEFLIEDQINKQDDVKAAQLTKAMVGRYLCIMYKDSPLCSVKFVDKERETFCVRRTASEEKEEREKTVPAFPNDVRLKIMAELKEELVGRSSARNLLTLMRSDDKTTTNKRKAEEPATTEGITSGNKETETGGSSSQESTARKRPNLGSSGPRPLGRQVSSPALTQGGSKGGNGANSGGNGAVAAPLALQGPWRREINELWAKQLAMMREINTLKSELARREQVRQNEILVMRQELDVMRAEFFRQRQAMGVAVASPAKDSEKRSSLKVSKSSSQTSVVAGTAGSEVEAGVGSNGETATEEKKSK